MKNLIKLAGITILSLIPLNSTAENPYSENFQQRHFPQQTKQNQQPQQFTIKEESHFGGLTFEKYNHYTPAIVYQRVPALKQVTDNCGNIYLVPTTICQPILVYDKNTCRDVRYEPDNCPIKKTLDCAGEITGGILNGAGEIIQGAGRLVEGAGQAITPSHRQHNPIPLTPQCNPNQFQRNPSIPYPPQPRYLPPTPEQINSRR